MFRNWITNLSRKYFGKFFTDLEKMSESIKTISSADGEQNENGRKRSAEREGNQPARKKQKGKQKKEVVVQQLSTRADKARKVALFLMYSGKGYFGIQRQKDNLPTIEGKLLTALHKLEVIPPEAVETPQEVAFQRAARTDKGVSAMLMNVEDFVEKINDALPAQIRVVDCVRTTKLFNCKNFCDGRTYAYLTPTHAFSPKDKHVTADYRIPDETIAEINRLFQKFKGTHNFHNYTSRVKPTDASAKRYIISFECGKPFLQGDMEFAVITVRGQSFMLHQIRKMIGITIAIVKGCCEEDVLQKTWGHMKVDVPKAPGLGLMLEKLHYDNYNKRFGSDGMHEPLTWDKHQDVIDKFTKEVIYEDIIKTEKEENSMIEWLKTLSNHSFDQFDPKEEQERYQQKLERLNQLVAEKDSEATSSTCNMADHHETQSGSESTSSTCNMADQNRTHCDPVATLSTCTTVDQHEKHCGSETTSSANITVDPSGAHKAMELETASINSEMNTSNPIPANCDVTTEGRLSDCVSPVSDGYK